MNQLRKRAFLAGTAALAAPAVRAAPAPIRIGVLTEMGGPYAEDSGRGSVAAARFAIEDFCRDHPDIEVELVFADAQTKPDVAAAIAGAWFDRDGVDLVLDVPVSNCALAVASVARARNGVAIFNTSTSDLTGKACSPMPTDDPLFGRGRIREDGRKVHDTFLFRVKSPAASRDPWDLYELMHTKPAE